MTFIQKLEHCWQQNNSLLCVGFDPNWQKIPAHLKTLPEPIFEFCKAIADATHDLVCAFKPQIAYFAGLQAEDQLEKTLNYIRETYPHIPIILDSKRGDIGSTAAMYAVEAFDRFKADAVTINPYMGQDSAQPFLDRKDKGVVILCRTSNPGAGDIQDLEVDGEPIYQHVAGMITQHPGIALGAHGAISAPFYAERYGNKHFASIKSLASFILVVMTAISPIIFGWLIDQGRSMNSLALGGATYALLVSILGYTAYRLSLNQKAE